MKAMTTVNTKWSTNMKYRIVGSAGFEVFEKFGTSGIMFDSEYVTKEQGMDLYEVDLEHIRDVIGEEQYNYAVAANDWGHHNKTVAFYDCELEEVPLSLS